jgi:hypothetical protein
MHTNVDRSVPLEAVSSRAPRVRAARVEAGAAVAQGIPRRRRPISRARSRRLLASKAVRVDRGGRHCPRRCILRFHESHGRPRGTRRSSVPRAVGIALGVIERTALWLGVSRGSACTAIHPTLPDMAGLSSSLLGRGRARGAHADVGAHDRRRADRGGSMLGIDPPRDAEGSAIALDAERAPRSEPQASEVQ